MSGEEHRKDSDEEFFPENVELLRFIGGWDCDVGIDTISMWFYLIRTADLDWLEAVATSNRKLLSRRCTVNAPREGGPQDAAARLLDRYVWSRVHCDWPVSPFQSGLLAADQLESIVKAVGDELDRNSQAAEDEQRPQEAPIVATARALGLGPRPAGHNEKSWMARCPAGAHSIMISPSADQFGCGYCRSKGGPFELRAFCGRIRAKQKVQ